MSDLNETGKVYERPWGTYQTLNFTDKSQTKIITVKPKGSCHCKSTLKELSIG